MEKSTSKKDPSIVPSICNNLILKELLGISNELIIVLDQELNIALLNDNAAKLYNWQKSRVIGKNYLELCEKHKFQPFVPKKKLAKNKLQSFNKFENAIVSPKFATRIVVWTGKVIKCDKCQCLLAIGNDVTKFKSCEEQGQIKNEYLRSILNYLPGYIFWKDRNSVIQGCNKNFADLIGETTESIVGKTDYELPWTLEEAEFFIANDKKVMASGKPDFNIEKTTRLTDGEEVILLAHKIPLLDTKGTVVGVIGIATDITEQKKIEQELMLTKKQAEAANIAKTKFLRNMGHDIRTPFMGVLEVARSMFEKEDNAIKQKYLSYIIQSSERLLEFFDEILEVAKKEAANGPIKYSKFKFKSLLDEIVEIMSAQIQNKELDIIIDYDPDLPEYVVSDKLKLHRIFLNLISNAIKYTAKGIINIAVSIIAREPNKVIIKFVVTDTGIGIPKDKFDAIFEDFSRVAISHQGTGLGLGIAKQFINDIGGKIEVESQEGTGSKFICVFPCKLKYTD